MGLCYVCVYVIVEVSSTFVYECFPMTMIAIYIL